MKSRLVTYHKKMKIINAMITASTTRTTTMIIATGNPPEPDSSSGFAVGSTMKKEGIPMKEDT
jgi:hypothetical protein